MIYTLENQQLRVQINSVGSELWSVFDKRESKERIWEGNPEVWGRRSPNLFPFCGRLKNDEYFIDNKTYKATLHGFAKDFEHKLSELGRDSITLCFTENSETLKKYPFSFNLYTRYELKGDQLVCAFKTENISDTIMPFSIGYHTGYTFPFGASDSTEDYCLVFDKKEAAEELLCDKNGLLTGEKKNYLNLDTIPLHNKLFSNGSFILTKLKSEYVSIVEKKTGRAVKVRIKDFPYVVFWSMPDNIPFICIEPWYGLPDRAGTNGNFLDKEGIIKLERGKSFECSQVISFS